MRRWLGRCGQTRSATLAGVGRLDIACVGDADVVDYADVYERCILLPSGNVDQMPIALANKMCKKMMFCLTWIGLSKREPLRVLIHGLLLMNKL